MKTKTEVKVRLEPGARMPVRAHDTDTGYDIHVWKVSFAGGTWGSVSFLRDKAKAWFGGDNKVYSLLNAFFDSKFMKTISKPSVVIIDTGVAVQPPEGYYFKGYPNSRSAKRGYILGNCVGVIDQGYTGTIKYIYKILPWCSDEDYNNLIKEGSVCGQIVLSKRNDADFKQVDSLDETDRNEGGFGSTEGK